MRKCGDFKLLNCFGLGEVLRRSSKVSAWNMEIHHLRWLIFRIQQVIINAAEENTRWSPKIPTSLLTAGTSRCEASRATCGAQLFHFSTSDASFTMRRGDVSEASVTSQFLLTVWNPGPYSSGEFHRWPLPTCVPLTAQRFEFPFRSSPDRLTLPSEWMGLSLKWYAAFECSFYLSEQMIHNCWGLDPKCHLPFVLIKNPSSPNGRGPLGDEGSCSRFSSSPLRGCALGFSLAGHSERLSVISPFLALFCSGEGFSPQPEVTEEG